MKTIIAIFLITSSAQISTAYGKKISWYLEVMETAPDLKTSLQVNAKMNLNLNPTWSVTGFCLIKPGFAEAMFGGAYQPLTWLKIGASFGLAQGAEPKLRFGINLFFGIQWISLYGILEINHDVATDPTGWWFDAEITSRPIAWLIFGIKTRRFVGVGPLIKFKIQYFELWYSWNPINHESKEVFDPLRMMFGIKFETSQ